MAYININKETVIGWYDESADHFLCDNCFSDECDRKNIKEESYYPVTEERLKPDDLYICDECGKRWQES